MAEGRDETPAFSFRKAFPFTELFRCFQVALDPRKLLVAAAGILVMSIGWWLLSTIFWYPEPDKNAPEYTDERTIQRAVGKKSNEAEYTSDELKQKGQEKYQQDLANWKVLDELAGPDHRGRLRTMPWYEYRGPNPYLFATQLAGSPSATWANSVWTYVTSQAPVLAEPLVKFLLPVIKIIDPNAGTQTRIYLLLVILWSVATWAFFGGIITRIAAVQLSGKDRISLKEAVRYVATRYLSYVLSPLVPLGIIAVVVIGLALFGLVALIPIVGDVILYGIGFPLVVLGGVVIAILLVGLVGYPLMYTTLSTEGSDTFDALSRSYNYVFQAPWQYLWYAFVAVLYGAVVTFFVVLVGSLMIYLGKWSISQAPLNETTDQRPDYLFVWAPESFGWKELLLKGSPIEVRSEISTESGRAVASYPYTDPVRAQRYKDSYQGWNKAGAGMVTFWLVLVFLLMLGFSYSYFWSATTMIYLLMRRKVDEIDLDEVYLESEPEVPPAPPTTPGTGVASLPMVPPPPAPVSYTGPVGSLGTPPTVGSIPPAQPSTSDGEKKAEGPPSESPADGEKTK